MSPSYGRSFKGQAEGFGSFSLAALDLEQPPCRPYV